MFFYRTALLKGPQDAFLISIISLMQNLLVFLYAGWEHEAPPDEQLLRHGQRIEEEVASKFTNVFRVGVYVGLVGYAAAYAICVLCN